MFEEGDKVVLTQSGKKFLSDFSSNIKRAMKDGRTVVGVIEGYNHGGDCCVMFNFDGKAEDWYVRADTDIEQFFEEDDFQTEDMSYILC